MCDVDDRVSWIVFLLKIVYNFLKECGTYYLATVEDDQPRVITF